MPREERELEFGEYVGIPFREHGRDRAGVDCWGVLWLTYREKFNIELPDYITQYDDTNDAVHLGGLIRRYLPIGWREISVGKEKPGDGILLRVCGQPMHIGVVIGNGRMLHVHKGINVVIESYKSAIWKNRVIGFYRHQDMK
jgi:cell wall-associated NlpC family hydrolase